MRERFEVAIVGGGPAGSSCAHDMAKAGVNVALFDHSHPREKPCGGAVSARVFDELEVPESVVERRINTLVVESPNGQRIQMPCRNAGILVMREKFDHWLLERAVKAGAKHVKHMVRDVSLKDDSWSIKTGKGTYQSKFLVGADGVHSLIRKTVSKPIPKEDLGHCIGYHIRHDSEYIKGSFGDALEFYLFGKSNISMGYAWIFPKFEYITVGIGSRLGEGNLKGFLERFLRTHPSARRVRQPKDSEMHSYLIPFASDPGFFDLPTSGKNWALVGDAAGHVSPLTGEGIYYAIIGGRLAAKAYLEGDARHYDKYWKKKYGDELRWGSRLQGVFYRKSTLNLLIKVAKRSPCMQKVLCELLAPKRYSYKKLLLHVFPLNLPKILIEYAF